MVESSQEYGIPILARLMKHAGFVEHDVVAILTAQMAAHFEVGYLGQLFPESSFYQAGQDGGKGSKIDVDFDDTSTVWRARSDVPECALKCYLLLKHKIVSCTLSFAKGMKIWSVNVKAAPAPVSRLAESFRRSLSPPTYTIEVVIKDTDIGGLKQWLQHWSRGEITTRAMAELQLRGYVDTYKTELPADLDVTQAVVQTLPSEGLASLEPEKRDVVEKIGSYLGQLLKKERKGWFPAHRYGHLTAVHLFWNVNLKPGAEDGRDLRPWMKAELCADLNLVHIALALLASEDKIVLVAAETGVSVSPHPVAT